MKGNSEGRRGYVGGSCDLQGSDHVISGVTLVEIAENTVVHTLHSGHDEDAPERCQLHDRVTMLDQVLDLGREVEAQFGVAVTHLPNDPERVLHTVQEIRVAKVDVLRPHAHEIVDICEHDLLLNYSKPPLIDSGDRTVPAPMSTTTAGLDISHQPELPSGGPQAGILLQGR